MKRKLVRQGQSTLMISLPSKWIRQNSLDKGSDVELQEENNKIVISGATQQAQKREMTINLTEENRHDIANMLTHIYRGGFDRITVKGIDNEIASNIRKVTNDILLGFEIVDMSSTFCIIENISEPSEEKYDVMMRRIFLIIKETHRTLSEDMEKGRMERFAEIEEQRKQLDKHTLFCRRVYVKEKHQDPLEWELLTFLMHIEHKYYYLYKYMHENRCVSDKDFKALFKQLGAYLDMYYDAYFQKDIIKIHDINKARNEFYFKKCYSAIEKSSGKKSVIIGQIAEIYRLIQTGTSPILGKLIAQKIATH